MKQLIYLLILSTIILIACKKNNNKVLVDNILPDTDILNAYYTDTFSIYLKTEKIDSIRIYNDGFKF
jgi:hypothetical protein